MSAAIALRDYRACKHRPGQSGRSADSSGPPNLCPASLANLSNRYLYMLCPGCSECQLVVAAYQRAFPEKKRTILLMTSAAMNGQIVINELSSRNSETLKDLDNDSPDWIELYNTGNVPVNLLGWTLSDEINQLDKWIFPNVSLLPDSVSFGIYIFK